MSESWQELAMIAFIVVGIAAAIWKGGQANPEGTGSLGKKLARLENDVRSVRRDGATTASKVQEIERHMQDIESRAAKASDIERLERVVSDQGRQIERQNEMLSKLAEAVAAVNAAGDQRGKQLDRLYDFIVQKGMNA